MFLTNRSLLALWLAFLFLSLFILALAPVMQEEDYYPGLPNLLETIFFFAMTTIQTQIHRSGLAPVANDESVQEPAKQPSECLEAVVNVSVMVAFIVICSILTLFVQRLTQHVHVFFWAIGILISVANMLYTLRSQRLTAGQKQKRMPSTSD